jgi:hypothetical protein
MSDWLTWQIEIAAKRPNLELNQLEVCFLRVLYSRRTSKNNYS